MQIKEASLEEVMKVHETIAEFDQGYFERKNYPYKEKDHLILVGYENNTPIAYLIGYDKYQDGSFFCWSVGINPEYRHKGNLQLLMEQEDIWAKEHGYKKIKVKTRNKFRFMLSYLIHHGYNITGIKHSSTLDNAGVYLEKNII